MAQTYTKNYQFGKPIVGQETDTWGADINATIDLIDDNIKAVSDAATSAQNTANAALPKTGGTLQGLLTLSGAPTVDLHAATKIYVDDSVKTASDAAATKLPLSGGSLTGPLILKADPTNALGAATKQYVDQAAYLPLSGGNMTGKITFSGAQTTATTGTPGIVQLTDSTSSTSTTTAATPNSVKSAYDLASSANSKTSAASTTAAGIVQLTDGINSNSTTTAATANSVKTAYDKANAALPLSGGTLTGALTLSGAPTVNLHAATKKYVDDSVTTSLNGGLPVSGGTMTGTIAFAATQPTATTTSPNIVQLNDSVASTSVTTAATANSVKTAYDKASAALPIAGGTMTGALTLSGAPTADNHAATKKYVDGFQPLDSDLTSIAGLADTSTGLLKKTAANQWALDTSAYLTANQSITLSGDASGSGTTTISVALKAQSITAGAYGGGSAIPVVTVNGKGIVTAISTASPDWNGVINRPTTLSGYGITDALSSASGGTIGGNISVSGSITASGDITAFSDASIKDNITQIDAALNLVEKMRGVRFTRKDNGDAGVGVIAQEMRDVLPEVVKNGEILSVAYGNIVGVLIEAIKELSNRVKELEAR